MRTLGCSISSHQAAAFTQVYSTYSVTSDDITSQEHQKINIIHNRNLKRHRWTVWTVTKAPGVSLCYMLLLRYPRVRMQTCMCEFVILSEMCWSLGDPSACIVFLSGAAEPKERLLKDKGGSET